ncbi:MAG: ACT domain-containing protein [Ruminococcaceae bacterium]|nr:ACT domain-containing protein [Oscillospiraceae bacterium]
MRAVITVVGQDKIGIIAEVSRVLADNKINILDISQTIMQDMFTMIMLVNVDKSVVSFKEISETLHQLGESLHLSIRIQHEDLFHSMHRI